MRSYVFGFALCAVHTLAFLAPVGANAGSAFSCSGNISGNQAAVDARDSLPLQMVPDGPAGTWAGYHIRLTYLDEQGRYVTVYHDPNWQHRVYRAGCPLS